MRYSAINRLFSAFMSIVLVLGLCPIVAVAGEAELQQSSSVATLSAEEGGEDATSEEPASTDEGSIGSEGNSDSSIDAPSVDPEEGMDEQGEFSGAVEPSTDPQDVSVAEGAEDEANVDSTDLDVPLQEDSEFVDEEPSVELLAASSNEGSTQVVEQIYAIFDSADGSLVFHATSTAPKPSGSQKVYALFDTDWLQPWHDVAPSIQSVRFEGEVTPQSTSRWFNGCASLTSIDLSGLNTAQVTDMSGMFAGCTSLASIDLSGLDTSCVTSMASMFDGCTSLVSIDLSGLNTAQVRGMSGMFQGCTSLVSIDLSGLNTALVADMSDMFQGCTSLASIDLSGLNTARVTDMSGMFWACTSLASIDLSGLNTAQVRDMDNMFWACSSLCQITLGGTNPFRGYGSTLASLPQTTKFWSWGKGAVDSQERFTSDELVSADYSNGKMAGTYYWCEWRPYAVFDPVDGSLVFHEASTVPEPFGSQEVYTGFDTKLYDGFVSYTPWFKVRHSIKTVRFEGRVPTKTTCYWFYDCSSITSVDLSGLDTSCVTSMASMFAGCTSLASLDLSRMDTSCVTSMASMFAGCTSLASLDLSGMDTSCVTYMGSMLKNCAALASVDLSGLDTSSVTDMQYMFSGCASLASIDLSGLDTSSVTNMQYMFSGCASLASIDLSGLDTSTVTNMQYMFSGCTNLESADLSGLDATNLTKMCNMFADCSSLSLVSLNGLNVPNVTDMSNMFRGCTSLESVSFFGTDAPKLTNILSMFYNCSSLQSIDLSGLRTSSVTEMGSMFFGCTSLASLDLSGINSSNATKAYDMFSGCDSLVQITLGETNPFKSTSTSVTGEMLQQSAADWSWGQGSADSPRRFTSAELASADYSGGRMAGTYYWSEWHSYAVFNEADGSLVFNSAQAVPKSSGSQRVYTGFDTRIYTLGYMPWRDVVASIKSVRFEGGVGPLSVYGWFSGCTSLSSVDLSGLDLSKATDMRYMLDSCASLASVDLSGLDTSRVTDMSCLFSGCTSLSSVNLSGLDTSSVTDINYLFSGCTSLSSVNLSGLDTSSMTDMNYLFSGCTSLSSVNLSGLDTSSVTDMHYMFANCSSLASIDLSSLDTSSVTGMGSMFSGCMSLTSLDLSGFDTSKVKYMKNMFSGCTSLASIDLSGFDASLVTNMDGMFSGCTSISKVTLGNTNPFKGAESAVSLLPQETEGWSWGKGSADSTERYSSESLASADYSDGAMAGTYYWSKWHFAVYDSADGSLTFKAGIPSDTGGSQTVFTGFDSANYAAPSDVPWDSVRASIKSVAFDSTITPISTAYWFSGCSALETLDLSGLDISATENTTSMFEGCTSITRLILGESNPFRTTGGITEALPQAASSWSWGKGSPESEERYTSASLATADYSEGAMAGEYYWSISEWCEYAVFDSDSRSLTFKTGIPRGIEDSQTVYTGFDSIGYASASDVPWASVSSSIESVVFEDAITPRSTAFWFSGCTSLEYIDFTGLDTSSVVDSAEMFAGCSFNRIKLGSRTDLKKIDTLPTPSSEHPFTGLWSNTQSGNPMSPGELKEIYDPAMMSGEYVWDYEIGGFQSFSLGADGRETIIDEDNRIVSVYVSSDYSQGESAASFTLDDGVEAYLSNPKEVPTAQELAPNTDALSIPIGGSTNVYLTDGGWKVDEWQISVRAFDDYCWLAVDSEVAGASSYGQTADTPIDIVVKNVGNRPISGIAEGLSLEGDVQSFVCSVVKDGELLTGDLQPNDEAVLRVLPDGGLTVGEYSLRIAINPEGMAEPSVVNVAFEVTKAGQPTPAGISCIPAILDARDGSMLDPGSLIGFDPAELYEYRPAGGAGWLTVPLSEARVDGLAEGAYEIRYSGDANHDPSEAAIVRVLGLQRSETTGLLDAISAATGSSTNINESADGSDVYLDERWATPEAFATLQAAIADAQAVADDVRATQDEVDAAVVTLNDAAAAFEASCFYGAKLFDFGEAMIEGIQAKTYTGSGLTQDLAVTWRGEELKEGRDYTVSYENNVDATAVSGSKARVIVTGAGNYDATAQTFEFEIAPAEIADATIGTIDPQIYTGDPLAPEPEIVFNGNTLTKDTDYTLSYSNNVKPGTADAKPTVTLTGIGNFQGTVSTEFAVKYDLSKGSVEPITGKGFYVDEDYEVLYPMGTNPEIRVCNELGKVLAEGADFEKTYDAANDTVTVQGVGDYTGTLEGHYRIADEPISIADRCNWYMDGLYLYRGEPVKPEAKLGIFNGPGDNSMEQGVDYTVEYRNCDGPGTATAVFKGINQFTGQIEVPYDIVKKVNLEDNAFLRIEGDAISGSEWQVLDAGQTKKAPAEVTIGSDNGTHQLEEGVDYALTYSIPTSTGSASVTAKGLGACIGSVSRSYRVVNRLNISNLTADVALESGKYAYTGSAVEPKLTEIVLPASGYRLTEGVDYTLSYANNTDCGTATVTVTGKGKLSGSKTLEFEIVKDIDKPLLSNCAISISPERVVFTGRPVEPTITVAYADSGIVAENWMWNTPRTTWTNAGEYTVRLYASDNGAFSGTAEARFTIEPADIAGVDVAGAARLNDNGTLLESPTLSFNGIKLNPGSDYRIASYEAEGSKVHFTVTGLGNFTGNKEFSVRLATHVLSSSQYDVWFDPSIPSMGEGVPEYPFLGEPISPGVSVENKATGQLLVQGRDYEVTYRGDDSVGTAYAVVAGIGRYTGTIERAYVLSEDKIDISRDYQIEAATLYKWSGQPVEPTVTGVVSKTWSFQRLDPKTDYDVSYINNDRIGVGTIVVEGKGGYTGRIELDFAIVDGKINIGETGQLVIDTQALYTVDGDDASVVIVDGAATLPDIYVAAKIGSYTSETLVEGRDYTVSYRDNTYPGTAYAVLTGIGAYEGTYSFRFKAVKSIDISKGFFQLERDEYLYTGSRIKPTPLAKSLVSGQDLEYMREYVVEYGENTELGTGTVTINGRGDKLTGKQVLTFSIVEELGQRDLADCVVEGIPDEIQYTGSRITPSFVVRDPASGCALFPLSDYEYRFKDNVNAGTATLEIWRSSGKGYCGSKTVTFKIVPRDASGLGAVMTGISGRTYNGKAQAQSPKVAVGETTLVEGKDYNLVYKNNVNAGTAVVSAVGAGNYAGTLASATFSIAKANNPMAVKAVAKTVKAKKVKKKKQTVAGCVKFTKKAQGKVTYKKVSGAKKLSINAKTGKITVKKGTKKGTYKIKVRVTAAGNANYKAATKTLTLKVKVK